MRRIDTEEGFERVHAGIALYTHTMYLHTGYDLVVRRAELDTTTEMDRHTQPIWSYTPNVQNLPMRQNSLWIDATNNSLMLCSKMEKQKETIG